MSRSSRTRSLGGTSNARTRGTRSVRGNTSGGRYRYLQGSRGFRGTSAQSRSRDTARVGSRRGFTGSQRTGGTGRIGSQRSTGRISGQRSSTRTARHGFTGGTRHHGRHVGASHRGYPWVNGHYYPYSRGYWGFYFNHHHYRYPYYSFWYPSYVNYCYVPYGFYGGGSAIYINSSPYVYDDYGTVEEPAAPAKNEGDVAEAPAEEPDPVQATSSATTEKYLREASEAFRSADYETAAKKFRLAALSSPTEAGPLFALGQSLVALKQDAYAARVIREAVTLSPEIVSEPGDITGVFKSPEEFERVRAELESRAAKSDPGSDPQFLLAVERYFTGDARAIEDFDALAKVHPDDKTVSTFVAEAKKRFKTDKLPPIPGGK